MATLASLTLDVWDMVYGSAQIERPAEDTLSTTVTDASDVSWRFATPSLWKRGDYAESWTNDGVEGEIVVLAQDHQGTDASPTDTTIRRAQQRTTAAGGFSSGDVFFKNPTFTAAFVQKVIADVIDTDLGPRVWYRSKRTLTWDDTKTYYDLTAADFDVEEMYQRDIDGNTNMHPFPAGWWAVQTDVDSGAASSNRILRLYRVYDTTLTVYYTARTFPASGSISSLPDDIVAMIPYGVTARLLGTRAGARRNDPTRNVGTENMNQPYSDWQFFQQKFNEMKHQYWVKQLRQKMPQPRFRRSSVLRG